MSIEATKDALIAFVREHNAYAEPLVFLMGFAEGIPGLSLLVPSTPLFLGIGAAHSAAGGSFWHLWLAASIGAVSSDCLVYALGHWMKTDVARLRFMARYPNALERSHDLFARWGILAIIGGKFTGFLRPFIPVAAGISEMRFAVFLPSSIISSLAWAGAFLGPGYGIRWLID